jgi:hypothetical protein
MYSPLIRLEELREDKKISLRIAGILTKIRTSHLLGVTATSLQFPARAEDLPVIHNVHTDLGAQPLMQWVTRATPPGIQRSGHATDHSPSLILKN